MADLLALGLEAASHVVDGRLPPPDLARRLLSKAGTGRGIGTAPPIDAAAPPPPQP